MTITLSPLMAFLHRVGHYFFPPPLTPRPEVILPRVHTFVLTHTMTGEVARVEWITERLQDELCGIRTFGLSDVCRMALVEAIKRRPDEPAKHGDYWTLTRLP